MKITYIYHSCFMVEAKDAVYIFDYYKGKLPDLDRNKKIYVFSSHAHYDHYNKAIFRLLQEYPDVTYILSSDITDLPTDQNRPIYRVEAGAQYQIDDLKVQTLKSTDEGVAFILKHPKHSIYHAGDLNWWHWEGEPDEWNRDMAAAYKSELERLDGELFKLAFIPVDGRLGSAYSWGITEFMKHAGAAHIFPMHQWGAYDLNEQLLAETTADWRERVHKVSAAGDSWIIAD